VNTTSLSLLQRLKRAKPDAADWILLQDLYLPLVRRWLARVPELGDEVDDLSQEVLLVLLRELPSFERQRLGSFRAWLRQIVVNRTRAFCKLRQRQPRAGHGPETELLLEQLADPNGALAQEWDREHDKHVFKRMLEVVRPDFAANTWRAFVRFALDGLPAAIVAEEVGMTKNAVIQAKSRILNRLRQEAGELLD
jgi:RNA polymerase sigma-70 factor (ECF subfamily)